jgi:hypothetical protein
LLVANVQAPSWLGEKPSSVQKKRALVQKKSSSDNRNGSIDQKIWYSILANYEMIKGAQLSNMYYKEES